jgi:hypothetical protein
MRNSKFQIQDSEIEARPEDAIDPAIANEYQPAEPTQQERMWNDLKRRESSRAARIGAAVLLGVFVLAFVGAFFWGDEILQGFRITSRENQREREAAALRMDLYRAVTNAVSGKLKAPRTAIFCGPEEMKDDGCCNASGFVDSQNSFGALLRTKFTVYYSPRYSAKDPVKVGSVFVDEK